MHTYVNIPAKTYIFAHMPVKLLPGGEGMQKTQRNGPSFNPPDLEKGVPQIFARHGSPKSLICYVQLCAFAAGIISVSDGFLDVFGKSNTGKMNQIE